MEASRLYCGLRPKVSFPVLYGEPSEGLFGYKSRILLMCWSSWMELYPSSAGVSIAVRTARTSRSFLTKVGVKWVPLRGQNNDCVGIKTLTIV